MLGPEAPCEPWITTDDLCCDLTRFIVPPDPPPDPDEDPPPDPDPPVYLPIVASSIEAATGYLYDRTCRRWPGTSCTAIVRPCLPCECGFYPPGFVWPTMGYDYWPLGRRNGCRCRWRYFALQAPYPILEILDFTIGTESHPEWLRLDNNRDATLLDSSGLGCFPLQFQGQPDDGPEAWTVSYRFGAAPPEFAKRAAADFVCALLKDCPEGDCEELPDNAESVTKRGITVRFRLPADGITNVKTADWLIQEYGCPSTGTRRIIDPTERPYLYRGSVPPVGP